MFVCFFINFRTNVKSISLFCNCSLDNYISLKNNNIGKNAENSQVHHQAKAD